MVFADDGLFADNLSLFDPAVTRAEKEIALVRVGLIDEIERLPQGYATQVSEESGLLSTGQRRRLLLLDEVTANLDPDTETALVESLTGVKAAKVFITHSERLLAQVDRVLRIGDGRLFEDGKVAAETPPSVPPEPEAPKSEAPKPRPQARRAAGADPREAADPGFRLRLRSGRRLPAPCSRPR